MSLIEAVDVTSGGFGMQASLTIGEIQSTFNIFRIRPFIWVTKTRLSGPSL